MASEPCSCLLDVVGTIDGKGVLHTPQRLRLEVLHPVIPPEGLALREWRPPLTPEPCADPEWTEEALDATVAYMDEIEERAQLEAEHAAEWAAQRYISQWGTEYYG